MKILYLLFPLLLLLVQGAAGDPYKCIKRGGFCVFGGCRFPYKYVGTCTLVSHCCKLIWG
ncbi:PREDICTED: gallinacin-3-like [Lepidothrix coronata]|uniref:Gallinacin-3-like n=1 Tax=Lepidothrix coronata TaxID=321398 RepID=A0A6J0J8P6_9PASS|nr:PREDICTED: gallinacin-3-like [Lepidothrix coronata]